MNRRVLLVALLSAVAMFVWSAIAHMALPLGEAGIQEIPNEQALLDAMKTTIPSHGLYMFPNLPPDRDQTAFAQKLASGPSGLMVYFPRREFNYGAAIGVEFVIDFVLCLIAAWLLSLTALRTFGSRMGFYAAMGLAVAISTNVSFWNWYGFPARFTAAQVVTGVTEFLAAGLAAAWMMRKA